MLDLFRAGGAPMFFVVIFGLLALVSAALFVWRPSEARLRPLQALDRATLYSALAGVVAGLAAVGYHVPQNPAWAKSPDLALIVMTGVAESLSAPIFGFTFLALSAMLQSVGLRRLGRLG